MDQLFAIPSRVYVNEVYDQTELLSDWVDVATCGGILGRLEIENIDAGESVAVAYEMYNGAEFMGGSGASWDQVGFYQFGFGRGDFDNTTSVRIIATVTGSVRLNAQVYSVAQGEDVPEWP